MPKEWCHLKKNEFFIKIKKITMSFINIKPMISESHDNFFSKKRNTWSNTQIINADDFF